MDDSQPETPPSNAGGSPPSAKLPWVTPRLARIEAGAAENGFAPNQKDGAFTKS